MVGETLSKITGLVIESEEVIFETDNRKFLLYYDHVSDASCDVIDIVGDVSDLVGEPLLLAEEIINENINPESVTIPEYQDNFTWTFYKLSTIKGSVTIRWYGASNGYYSESVSFKEINHKNER